MPALGAGLRAATHQLLHWGSAIAPWASPDPPTLLALTLTLPLLALTVPQPPAPRQAMQELRASVPALEAGLHAATHQLSHDLEAIQAREARLDDQFHSLMSQYRATRGRMQGVQVRPGLGRGTTAARALHGGLCCHLKATPQCVHTRAGGKACAPPLVGCAGWMDGALVLGV